MSTIAEQRIIEFLKTEAKVRKWIEDVAKVSLVGEDLLYALKDGVVLCQLMLEIDPNSIPRVQKNTKIEFKLKENTFFFLEACKEIGVPKHKLFQTADLWEPKGSIVRVVECLVVLANVAEKRGFQALPRGDSDVEIKLPDPEKLAELKAMLPSFNRALASISTVGPSPISSPIVAPASAKFNSELQRRHFTGLPSDLKAATTVLRGIVRFQALFRAFRIRHLHKKQIRDLAYRQKVAKEILKTEEDYVNNLEICIKVYLGKMNSRLAKKPRSYLTKEQVKILFSDIQLIHNFNERLLTNIKERVENWSAYQKLGDIFLEIVAFMKVYTNYVQNFDKSISILETLQKKDKFKRLLLKCKNQPETKLLELSAFLIMPVQRIPRYNLLLQDLVKHTWEGHPDYENLAKAVTEVRSVALSINEKKRDAEEISLAFDMQNLIEDKQALEVVPQRRFVKDGQLFDVKHNKERVVFLFNDVIVLGKSLGSPKSGGKSRIKCSQWLAIIQSDIHEHSDVKKNKNCIAFGEIILAAKTEEERNEWLTAAKKVRLEFKGDKRFSSEDTNSHASEDSSDSESATSSNGTSSLRNSIEAGSLSASSIPAFGRSHSKSISSNGSTSEYTDRRRTPTYSEKRHTPTSDKRNTPTSLSASSAIETAIINPLQGDLQQPTLEEDSSDLFITKTIIVQQLQSIDAKLKKPDSKSNERELHALREKITIELDSIEKQLRNKGSNNKPAPAHLVPTANHLRTRSSSGPGANATGSTVSNIHPQGAYVSL